MGTGVGGGGGGSVRRTQVGGVAEVVDDGECEVEVPRLHVPRGAYQLRDDAPHLLDRTVC